MDHDGCVTCSDAGIPVRVLSVEGDDALCEDAADNRARIAVELVAPVRVVFVEGDDALCEDSAGNRAQIAVELVAPVRVGEVLLTHGGVAIGRVAAQEEDS